MKLRNLMWGACACALMAGCSNDDVAESSIQTNTDEELYMAVRIVAANDGMSRAEPGTPEFEDGSETEGAVTSGVFYFYDENGNCVAKGVNNSLSVSSQTPENDNIERVSEAVIILNDVAATPTEVIAVLNGDANALDDVASDGTITSKTKDEAMKALVNGSGAYKNNEHFVMTSSTYNDGTGVCCAIPISTVNLQKTEELAKQHPVDIYVERLAAKVQLTEKDGKATINDVEDVNINGTSNSTLHIAVKGWGLSAINKSGYYLKNLDDSWNNTTLWSGWNVAGNHRSYWAKDPNYSSSDAPVYPTDYNDYASKNSGSAPTITNSSSLEYLTYARLDKNMTDNNIAYCLENTMDVTTLAYNAANTPKVNAAAVTHILIAATVYADGDDGQTKQTLYRYKGFFYNEANYKNATLLDLQAVTGDLYKKTENGVTTYTQIGADDITIENKGDGKVNIKLANADEIWYTTEDKSQYTQYTGNVTSQINNLSLADGFKNGMMYYCVPIEHLNTTAGAVGSYGVVRNHWYQLTLESISGLGTAVYDPDEEIIPNYNPEQYYVAARLNVLSWHMVSQSVNL